MKYFAFFSKKTKKENVKPAPVFPFSLKNSKSFIQIQIYMPKNALPLVFHEPFEKQFRITPSVILRMAALNKVLNQECGEQRRRADLQRGLQRTRKNNRAATAKTDDCQ